MIRLHVLVATCSLGVIGASYAIAASDDHAISATQQLITVEDVIRQAVIGDPNSLTWNDARSRLSATSADSAQVAVVVRRGNSDQGTNDAELYVYNTSELLSDPRPQIVARFSSASNQQPIALVRWLADSRTVVFAGARGVGPAQVYRVDLPAGRLTQLSAESTPIDWYDITPSGTTLVIATPSPHVPPAENPQCLQHGCRDRKSVV